MEQLSHLSTPNNVLYVMVLPNRERETRENLPPSRQPSFWVLVFGFQ